MSGSHGVMPSGVSVNKRKKQSSFSRNSMTHTNFGVLNKTRMCSHVFVPVLHINTYAFKSAFGETKLNSLNGFKTKFLKAFVYIKSC